MQAIERRGFQRWREGNSGTEELRTRYIVPGADHRAVKADPLLFGIPDPRGFPLLGYPGHPTLLIRDLDVQDSGNGARVEALFSTRRGGRLRETAEDISAQEYTWSSSIERVAVEIPIAGLKTPALNNGEGGKVDPRWVGSTYTVVEKRPGLEVTFIANFNEFTKPPFDALEKFYKQDDRIHEIGGAFWKLNVRSITPDDKHQHRITLSWQLDAGTPQTLLALPSPKVSYPGILPGFLNYEGPTPFGGLIRNPWHHLDLVEPDEPGDLPKVVQKLDFEFGDLDNLPIPPGVFP
jgi:hypothetical protein